MMLLVQTHLMKWWPSVIASVLCVLIFFFLLENSKGLSFKAGCLISMWQSSFEGFMASLVSQSPHITQNRLGECESSVAMNLYLSKTLGIFS